MTSRPTYNDESVKRAAISKILPSLRIWCNEGIRFNEDDVIYDILGALKWGGTDGYELARKLDHWDPDAQLVEILDDINLYLHSALTEACIEWVKEINLTEIPIGTKVKCKFDPRNKGLTGEIVHNHLDGTSTVRFEELGHVKKGEAISNGGGTIGFVYAWEKLEIQ